MAEAQKRRASEVFGERLRAARKLRSYTQQGLADRMTDVGFPMSKTTMIRIEKGQGERGLTLDEALAFAAVLPASPIHLLTPEPGVEIALTDAHSTDAHRIRDWFRTGTIGRLYHREADGSLVIDTPPGHFMMGRPTTKLRERFEREMASRAESLLDAYRGGDEAGTRDALEGIFAAVDAHRSESEEVDDAG